MDQRRAHLVAPVPFEAPRRGWRIAAALGPRRWRRARAPRIRHQPRGGGRRIDEARPDRGVAAHLPAAGLPATAERVGEGAVHDEVRRARRIEAVPDVGDEPRERSLPVDAFGPQAVHPAVRLQRVERRFALDEEARAREVLVRVRLRQHRVEVVHLVLRGVDELVRERRDRVGRVERHAAVDDEQRVLDGRVERGDVGDGVRHRLLVEVGVGIEHPEQLQRALPRERSHHHRVGAFAQPSLELGDADHRDRRERVGRRTAHAADGFLHERVAALLADVAGRQPALSAHRRAGRAEDEEERDPRAALRRVEHRPGHRASGSVARVPEAARAAPAKRGTRGPIAAAPCRASPRSTAVLTQP